MARDGHNGLFVYMRCVEKINKIYGCAMRRCHSVPLGGYFMWCGKCRDCQEVAKVAMVVAACVKCREFQEIR